MLVADALAVLQQAGFSQTPGGVLLSGNAALLARRWLDYLRGALARFEPQEFAAPLFIGGETLDQAGYFANFPQNVVVAGSYNAPTAPQRYITPAACLHLYPTLRGVDLAAQPFTGLIMARCARYEGGNWEFPFRSPEFHMIELVVVGPEAHTARLYAEAERVLITTLAGLPGELVAATDAFFMGNDAGARLMQKLKELKKEYVVEVAGQAVAVASLNQHEGNFAGRFGLGEGITSFCLAFGLERLVAASLLLWGAAPDRWPVGLR